MAETMAEILSPLFLPLVRQKYLSARQKTNTAQNLKVEHRDSKCEFLKKSIFFLHRLILCNVFFKMTHVLPLISDQNGDKRHFKTDAAGLFLIKSDL